MPAYQVKFETITVAGTDFLIRSLLDRQQYSDPSGEAGRAGISSASWPLFGLLWPSARVLARAMHAVELKGRRVLEIGAGLGLASLVVHHRQGDMTVSDYHPLAAAFLAENVLLNHLPPLKFQSGNWQTENPDLGRFDLIIGSDLLYERGQPASLSAFIDRHASDRAEVIIVDPNRGNRSRFCQHMQALEFACSEAPAASPLENGEIYKGRILRFNRDRQVKVVVPIFLAQAA